NNYVVFNKLVPKRARFYEFFLFFSAIVILALLLICPCAIVIFVGATVIFSGIFLLLRQTMGKKTPKKMIQESTKLLMESNKEITESNKMMSKQLEVMFTKLLALAIFDGDERYADAIENEVKI
ncbi:hypothetical protein GIB67_021179, partial [Kingdonia uniflora]